MGVSRRQGTLITVLYRVTLYIESLARISSVKYASLITRVIYCYVAFAIIISIALFVKYVKFRNI